MNLGHGITGLALERACEAGLFRATGKRVLLRAIWAEQAHRSTAELTLGKDGRSMLNLMDAVAFEVCDVGPEVPAGAYTPGDVVLNCSISGEKIDPKNPGCPYVVVHADDIVGQIAARDVAALTNLSA